MVLYLSSPTRVMNCCNESTSTFSLYTPLLIWIVTGLLFFPGIELIAACTVLKSPVPSCDTLINFPVFLLTGKTCLRKWSIEYMVESNQGLNKTKLWGEPSNVRVAE